MKSFEERINKIAEDAKEVFGGDWVNVSFDSTFCFGGKNRSGYSLSIGFGSGRVVKFTTIDDMESYIESRRSPYPRELIHRKFSIK